MLSKDNYEAMKGFEVKDIPNLDVCVLGALEFLSEKDLPKIEPIVEGGVYGIEQLRL